MKKTDIKMYRERLISLRARLRGDVSHLADAALNQRRTDASGDLSSMPIHMADMGTDNYEQEFTLSLMQSDAELLDKVELALERIEDGKYAECEECGSKIPKQRLNVIPYATMCVKCAERVEEGGL